MDWVSPVKPGTPAAREHLERAKAMLMAEPRAIPLAGQLLLAMGVDPETVAVTVRAQMEMEPGKPVMLFLETEQMLGPSMVARVEHLMLEVRLQDPPTEDQSLPPAS